MAKVKEADRVGERQPGVELLQVAENVAREKNISKEEALKAVEEAIERTAKLKYGLDHNIRATIDRTTGDIRIWRVVTVVDEVENSASEVSLEEARLKEPEAEVGFEFTEELPPLEYGRAAAVGSRQVIVQKIREAEREHQYEEFIHRKGEIVSGIVKHADHRQVIVDIGQTEGVLYAEDGLPRQAYHVGDRLKALLVDIRPESSGPMLILSRAHNDFLKKLFEQDVTEVYDGLIKIVSVARDPGSRAKMAVYSPDNRVDAVGMCVGVRGIRVQSISSELQNERIDIIPWSADPATYVMNALSLQEVERVVIDEDEGRMDVIVGDDALSQAIGRRGQNVRLASLLTGWKIVVVPASEDSARRSEENAARVQTLTTALGIDSMLAQLLITEGFTTIDDLAQSDVEDVLSIEGITEAMAREIHKKAVSFSEQQEQAFFKKCEDLNIQDAFLELPNLDIAMFDKLLDAGVRTVDDVADLSTDELLDIIQDGSLSRAKAEAVIMEARKSWFDEEPAQEGSEESSVY